MDPEIRRMELLVEALLRERIVPLGALALAKNLLDRMRSPEPAPALLASLESMLEEVNQWYEHAVLSRVAAVCADHPEESAAFLARRVAGDRRFSHLNGILRRQRGHEFPVRTWPVPRVLVREHLRCDRPVCHHDRMIGYGHLSLAPLGAFPDPVPMVVACLVSGSHRRHARTRGGPTG